MDQSVEGLESLARSFYAPFVKYRTLNGACYHRRVGTLFSRTFCSIHVFVCWGQLEPFINGDLACLGWPPRHGDPVAYFLHQMIQLTTSTAHWPRVVANGFLARRSSSDDPNRP